MNYWGGQGQGDQHRCDMLTILIDANIIIMTMRIWEERAKVTNMGMMENCVLLTIFFSIYIYESFKISMGYAQAQGRSQM